MKFLEESGCPSADLTRYRRRLGYFHIFAVLVSSWPYYRRLKRWNLSDPMANQTFIRLAPCSLREEFRSSVSGVFRIIAKDINPRRSPTRFAGTVLARDHMRAARPGAPLG